jgi:hypothetical protein
MITAQQAYQYAQPGDHVIGWQLDSGQRADLLARCPAKYSQAVADHVTLRSKVDRNAALPQETQAEIVGRSDDGLGVEAMVVRIGATTGRPDGGTYHITWSLAEGREAIQSNDVIAARGWQPVDPPIAVRLEPRAFG